MYSSIKYKQMKNKYKITIEFETDEVISKKDIDNECKILSDEFLESDLYNISKISVKGDKLK